MKIDVLDKGYIELVDKLGDDLTPVNAAAKLRGLAINRNISVIDEVLADGSESCTADVWNIFVIQADLRGQKNFQFKLTNNSGGISTIEFAFMRVV